MALLRNKETGALVDAEDRSVQGALASGRWEPAGGDVAVVRADGVPGIIPADKVEQALHRGYRLEQPGETHERRLQKQYGDSGVTAGAEGFARGLSLGMYDDLAALAGGEEGVRERRARNSGAAFTGELAGVLAPALLSGGTSLAERAAGATPAGLLSQAGAGVAARVAESGMVRGLAEGGILARAAARALPVAAQGAVEGAFFGAGEANTQIALSEDPMNAEAILSTIGTNVLLGAGIGGVAGVGGKLLEEAAGKAKSAIRAFASRSAVGEDLAAAVAGVSRGDAKAALKLDIGDLKVQREAELGVLRADQKAARQELGALKKATATEADAVKSMVSEEAQTLKSMHGELKEARDAFEIQLGTLDEAARQVGGRAKLYADVIGSPEVSAARKALAASEADVRKLFPSIVEGETAKARTFALNMADEDLVHAIQQPAARAALQRHEENVIRALKLVNPDATATKIADLFESGISASDQAGNFLSRSQEVAARELDQIIAQRTGALSSPELERLTSATKGVEERLAKYADGLTSPKLQELDTALSKLEDAFKSQRGRAVLDAANKAAAGDEGFLSRFTTVDKLAAAAELGLPVDDIPVIGGALDMVLKLHLGMKLGGSKRGLSGLFNLNNLGQMLGRRLGGKWAGGAMGLVNVGGKLGNVVEGLGGMASKVSAKVADGIEAFASATGKAAKRAPAVAAKVATAASREERAAETKAVAAELARRATDPDGTRQAIHARLEGIRAIDMKLGDQMETGAMRQLDYLHSKAPKNPGLGSPFTGFKRGQLSDAEVSKFSRVIEAVKDPAGRLLDEMNSGRLTPETVDAVRETAPALFARVQQGLLEKASELREDMPYEKRAMLSILFGVAVDSVFRPEMVAALQANFAVAQQAEAQPQPKGGSMKRPEPTAAQELGG